MNDTQIRTSALKTDLLSNFDISDTAVEAFVADTLRGADDGELYLEYSQSEALTFDNGRLKGGSFNTDQGFGLRAVAGEAVGYAHSGEMSEAALKRAGEAVTAVTRGHSGSYAAAPARTNSRRYGDENPIGAPSFEEKVALLTEIDSYLRAADPARAAGHGLARGVVATCRDPSRRRPAGEATSRPMCGSTSPSSSAKATGRRPVPTASADARHFRRVPDRRKLEARRRRSAAPGAGQSLGRPAPAGTFDIVLGNGWPGVMLHEAVGHGLEGDFNRKKTSAFAGLMGQHGGGAGRDRGRRRHDRWRRGSITIDDEGTPAGYNVLIEDGRLVGYMQDRQNARLMGMTPTGNGRRESYAPTSRCRA
jgi:TldD protein